MAVCVGVGVRVLEGVVVRVQVGVEVAVAVLVLVEVGVGLGVSVGGRSSQNLLLLKSIHKNGAAYWIQLADRTFPVGAVAFRLGPEFAQEAFLELEDLPDVHTHDEGFGGGGWAVDQEDVVEFIAARGQDAGPFVDFGGVEQVEYGYFLYLQYLVHTFDTQPALAVEKVGDVGLLEAGLLGQAEAGQIALGNTLPQSLAKVILQSLEFHGRSITFIYSGLLLST